MPSSPDHSLPDHSHPSATSPLLTDAKLSARLERTEGLASVAYIEARRHLRPDSSAAWIEVAGTHAIFDGVDSPLTQTFGLGMQGAPTESDMHELETFFQERRAPVFHEVSPIAADGTLELLTGRGYRPIELTSVMLRPIPVDLQLAGRVAQDLRVRKATESDLSLWATVSAQGWSEHGDLSSLMSDLAEVNAARTDAQMFLVERGAETIAAGALNIQGEIGYLAGAATVPKHRRHGAQLALLEERLRVAAEQGCTLAMMCARPGSPSQRNAERHGFRIAYTRIKWQLHNP